MHKYEQMDSQRLADMYQKAKAVFEGSGANFVEVHFILRWLTEEYHRKAENYFLGADMKQIAAMDDYYIDSFHDYNDRPDKGI